MKSIKDNPCDGCVPPKRYPGCHSYCSDYIIAKAFHEAAKDEERLKNCANEYSYGMSRKRRDASVKRQLKFKRYNKGSAQ